MKCRPQIRRGFSFPEVLFAVAVLGIGFIMVAAIFPVAIMQTQATIEESTGTTITRNGIGYLQGCPYLTALRFPPTGPVPALPPGTPQPQGRVFSFNDPRMTTPPPSPTPPTPIPGTTPPPPHPGYPNAQQMWDSVKQNLIVPDDNRFAYIPMFSRDEGMPFARLFVIGVRVRGRDAFKPDVDTVRVGGAVAQLEPRPVAVQLKYRDTNPQTPTDRIWIKNVAAGDDAALAPLSAASGATGTSGGAVGAAAEGAFVIISDDRAGDDTTNTPLQNETGQRNGRIYRLGPEVIPAGQAPNSQAGYREFELAPGDDMANDRENIPPTTYPGGGNNAAIAFIVGRGYAGDPPAPASGYSGAVMAVQKYSSVVSLP